MLSAFSNNQPTNQPTNQRKSVGQEEATSRPLVPFCCRAGGKPVDNSDLLSALPANDSANCCCYSGDKPDKVEIITVHCALHLLER